MAARTVAGDSTRLKGSARRRFEEHVAYLAEHAPELTLTMKEDRGEAFIRGLLDVKLGAGRVGKYRIKLVYQGLNPFQTPDSFDDGDHFEHIIDRHIYPDGLFCLWLPVAEPHDFDHPDGLARHLERVAEFIVLQVHYDDRQARSLTPFWVGPQWSHGRQGWREWTSGHVQGLRPEQVRAFRRALSWTKSHGRSCPCGSGRALTACHRDWFAALRRAHQHDHGVWQALYVLSEGEDAHEALLAGQARRNAGRIAEERDRNAGDELAAD